MTESTQIQSTDNNNTAVVKMEPPPPPASSSTSDMAAPSSILEHLQQAAQHHKILQQHQQQYALKWNDFQTSILSSFRNLRDEEDFVDVTLACDKRSFTAHKVVLSACSPYFRKLLKANPCEHPIVILRDVCSNDVENLLSFMYNGEVNVSYENLSDFLKTAHLLQIRGLADVNSGLSPSFQTSSKSITASLRDTITNLSINNNDTNSNENGQSNSDGMEMLNVPSTTSLPNNNITNTVNSDVAFGASSFPAPSSGIITSTVNSSSFNGPSIAGTANTPAVQELKASSASPVRKTNSNKANNSWDIMDAESNRSGTHLTPPPQKRIKSADLFRAQHGISPERLLIDRDFPVVGQHPLTRERRDRSRDTSRDRDRNLELRDSLLSQALENNAGLGNQKLHTDLSSLHTQSAGEDSNSSDTEPSDRGDGQHDGTADSMNGSMERSFPNAFLGLQGIPGLLPGPSGINANDFASAKLANFLKTPIKTETVNDRENFDDEDDEANVIENITARTGTDTAVDIEELEEEYDNLQSTQLIKMEQSDSRQPCLQYLESNNNNNIKKLSIDLSPKYVNRSWRDTYVDIEKDHENANKMIDFECRIENENNNNDDVNDDDEDNFDDDNSSSTSSAISLTMKNSNQKDDSVLQYLSKKSLMSVAAIRPSTPMSVTAEQTLHSASSSIFQQNNKPYSHMHNIQVSNRDKEHQQQNQQPDEQHTQQKEYLNNLKHSAAVNHQQLTANLFMARTIALSRSRDFPDLFKTSSAAAVAAVAAVASSSTASTTHGNNGSGSYMLPCPLCETPLEQRVFRQHLDRHYPRDSPVCPVIECGRRFAHPNSVRNHMRIKHTIQWAKMKAMRSSGGPFAGGPDFK